MCVGEVNGGGRLTGREDINDHGRRRFVVRWSFGAAWRENSMRGCGSKAIEKNEESVVSRPCSPRSCGISQPQRIVQSRVKPPSGVEIDPSRPGTSRTETEGGLFVLVLFQSSCFPNPHSGSNRVKHRPTVCRVPNPIARHCNNPSIARTPLSLILRNLQKELSHMTKNKSKNWHWKMVVHRPARGGSQGLLLGRGRSESCSSPCSKPSNGWFNSERQVRSGRT